MAASGMAIDAWVEQLARIRPGDGPGDAFSRAVTTFVRTHPLDRRSLDPFAFFEERHYTRNLIF
jgi:hypothetical protein